MFKNISNRILNDVKTEHAIKNLAVRKPPIKERFKAWLKDKVTNFCSVTSLHGYVHTVNKEYHAFERWLWILLSFVALITAIVLLWISWNWTAETPTTTVIESTNYPTYNLPFPSLTICNMNKISKAAALATAKDM
jgi:acid-sensing ion channel, other